MMRNIVLVIALLVAAQYIGGKTEEAKKNDRASEKISDECSKEDVVRSKSNKERSSDKTNKDSR